jgi:predicted metal-binding membrane protein
MITAMMLPTTLPLLEAVRRLTRRRSDRRVLLGLVIAGYVVAWGMFGIVAHGFDGILRALVPGSEWLSTNGWVLGVIVFAIAGLFQFSPLKYRCLDKCRAPLSFVMRRWNGQNAARQAFLLGLGHGAYCVGCCWALMLLMFVLGTGSVGWMLLLAGVMAAEKNLPFGRQLAVPLGVTLLGTALVMTVHHAQPVLGDL